MSALPAARGGPDFDFIVAGAGSSGSIVAAELAADPAVRVLLVEAGGRAEENPETLRADGYKQAFINDRLMWERFSEPQPGCAGNRIFLGSGRGVGGSGSVNAMVYTRGSASDYAMWGTRGWAWADVAPVFEEIERRIRPHRMEPTEFTEACIRAAEGAGFARKEDLNDGELRGCLGYEWMNVEGDERRSSYVAFLAPRLGPPNLELAVHAHARRVLVEDGRACGLEYLAGGRTVTARARREVVLCAGALETPKLLLLSGIGPRDELAALGIPLVADVAGVGRNLQDHPNVVLFSSGRRPTDCHVPQLYGFHRANPASSLPPAQADTCYVFYPARSSFREGTMRLLPSMLLPPFLYRQAWLRRAMRGAIAGVFRIGLVRRLVDRMYGVVVILGKPQSRGTVRLRSRDPDEPARVDPAYFAEPEDLATLLLGIEKARAITAGAPLTEWGNHPLIPGGSVTGRKLERWVRRNAMTTYHYAGTCRMGEDEGAVVDARLRLRALAGLRIADASVMPVVPVSALNAPSMLIGYRAAQFLAEEHALERGPP